jgi:hypothetical protein
MHEIFIICFQTFFYILQLLIDTKRSTANLFRNIVQIRPDIQSFQNVTPRFRQKRKAWLSVVIENSELNLALSL